FGVIGALVLGEFAVKAHLFVPEILLYMAFVALANFTQPSYELGYAFKLWRVFLLICIGIFNIIGFIFGVILMILVLFFTPTILHHNYLYPLFPLNMKKLKELFIRVPIDKNNS
ncbi:MAG: spore germination protein, partial [Traorella sp.]